MPSEHTTKPREIIDLAAYRARRVRIPIHLEEAGPAPKDAEAALNEVARHLLMAVRVITSRNN
jgi:hypothetical protein